SQIDWNAAEVQFCNPYSEESRSCIPSRLMPGCTICSPLTICRMRKWWRTSLAQVERLTGTLPRVEYVDRGYKGHGMDGAAIWIACAKRGVTASLKDKLKRRNAVEPGIGHMKNDEHLGLSFLKGEAGDAINALLCDADHNLRQLALLCTQNWQLLRRLMHR
ncbi:MAG: hypothetical protein ABIR84_03205, partial [Candidatus Nitrotoga sp.]